MVYNEVFIETFCFTEKEAHVITSNRKGLTSKDGIRNEFGTFQNREQKFLKDICVLYAITEFALTSNKIVVEVPVSKFVKDTAQEFIGGLFSWLTHLEGRDVVATIQFKGGLDTSENSFSYEANVKTAVLGWSRGKESIASYEVAKEAGYEVFKTTFNKPIDRNPDASLSLISSGGLYKDPMTSCSFNFAKEGYFDFQGYICVPLLAMLMFEASNKKADTILIGSEYGTSERWNTPKGCVLDLAGDEGLYTAEYFSAYMLQEHNTTIKVHSPVATLLEVAIIRYIIDKGYKFSELESCWNYSLHGMKNCEACLKCNRLKVYGKYLMQRGFLKAKDFNKAFIVNDYADIATPELLTYSIATTTHIKEIKHNDTDVNWADVYIASPLEMAFTGGDFLTVIGKHFKRCSYTKADLGFRMYSKEYVRQECIRYLKGMDYSELTLNRVPLLGLLGFSLPYEYEVRYKESHNPFTTLDYFSKWEVYDNKGQSLGYYEILSHKIEGAEDDDEVFRATNERIGLWMLKDNIKKALKVAGIKHKFIKYAE